MNALQLKPALRPGASLGSGTKSERRYFDFVVDGVSLHALCVAQGYDEVGCLGWGGQAVLSSARARLLLSTPGDFTDGRVALFVCPECGDLGCGAVSVRIESAGDSILWTEFGWQTNYDPSWQPIPSLGSYSFDFDQYKAAIETATLLECEPSEPTG